MTTRKEIEDTAAGQRLFVEKNLTDTVDPGSNESLKKQIIRVAVNAYIDEAESTKKKLLNEVQFEKSKNKDIKGLAEQLARALLEVSPKHPLAEEVLALLLENKMKKGKPSP